MDCVRKSNQTRTYIIGAECWAGSWARERERFQPGLQDVTNRASQHHHPRCRNTRYHCGRGAIKEVQWLLNLLPLTFPVPEDWIQTSLDLPAGVTKTKWGQILLFWNSSYSSKNVDSHVEVHHAGNKPISFVVMFVSAHVTYDCKIYSCVKC